MRARSGLGDADDQGELPRGKEGRLARSSIFLDAIEAVRRSQDGTDALIARDPFQDCLGPGRDTQLGKLRGGWMPVENAVLQWAHDENAKAHRLCQGQHV